jgi:hypothetical protein
MEFEWKCEKEKKNDFFTGGRLVILAQFALGGSRNQRGKGAIMRFRKKKRNFFFEKYNVLQKRKKI